MMKQNSTDDSIKLITQLYFNNGFSPSDLDKLSLDQLEIMIELREKGFVGFSPPLQKDINKQYELLLEPHESRIVITPDGYIFMVGMKNEVSR